MKRNADKLLIIKSIKNNEIFYRDIPIELKSDADIIDAERKYGMRAYSNRGYDIISNSFFVEEIISDIFGEETITNNFESFDEYYKYLDGNIYEKSCYYQYQFLPKQIKEYNIDIKRINNEALIDYTIKDDSLDAELSKINDDYKNSKLKKQKNELWIKKALECKNLQEYKKNLENYRKSKYYEYYFEDVIVYFFIKNNPKKAFKILMDSINNYDYIISEEKMCLYFSPNKVLNSINYNKNIRTAKTANKHIKKINSFAESLNEKKVVKNTKCKYDIRTNYYIVEEAYTVEGNTFPITIKKYFDNINELTNYLEDDLSNCDLSKAPISNDEIVNCKINENTILPLSNVKTSHVISKYYEHGCFCVLQRWIDINNNIVNERKKKFRHFFDFVYYLNNDLSNADLLFCDGLANLKSVKEINFNNAHIRSDILDRLGLKYEKINKIDNELVSFDETKKNEQETQLVLESNRELLLNDTNNNFKKVSYVSDIHLKHRLNKCKSIYDIEFIIRDIIANILQDSGNILLIGGDVSSSYDLYGIFITELSKEVKKRNIKIIFTLGNHELWCESNYFLFRNKNLQEIIDEYRKLIISQDMYLVQNNLLYIEEDTIHSISEEEINILSCNEIRQKTKKSNLIIFGGLGYSGFNIEFNANKGIYRWTLNRDDEIEETNKFKKIYDKLVDSISDKNVIVFTHTPKKDWSETKEYVKNWVYVSGHTHRNYFYDDGEYRIYSDNQLGYNYKTAYSKSFYIEYDYDIFSDYKDGIYTINKSDYINFYRGKNIMMDYNREGDIFMLKKNGYYCFIKPSMSGLSIMNGGSLKSLEYNDINYYYDNMDAQIALNREPLDKYTKHQEIIASQIKKIGGLGTIHGSIIDIDFFNHIYVNPFDGTLSGYMALNIIDKYVYPNIPSLLKAECPTLYANYKKQLESTKNNALIVKNERNEIILKPTYYESTDIYKASRIIKKMQKLNSGVLTVWHDNYKKSLNSNNALTTT